MKIQDSEIQKAQLIAQIKKYKKLTKSRVFIWDPFSDCGLGSNYKAAIHKGWVGLKYTRPGSKLWVVRMVVRPAAMTFAGHGQELKRPRCQRVGVVAVSPTAHMNRESNGHDLHCSREQKV